jgi:Protein of unknown function VcgC/VcgE (DUF2780)
MKCLRISRNIFCLTVFAVLVCQTTLAQSSKATTASPELVNELTSGLSITPAQATGGAGALFGLAKTRLSAADFSKVAAAVPGMGGFLKAAPAADNKSALSSLTGSLPAEVGGLASTAGAFQKLGLSPDMAGKFVPILTSFVQSKGGANVASLLSGALQ